MPGSDSPASQGWPHLPIAHPATRHPRRSQGTPQPRFTRSHATPSPSIVFHHNNPQIRKTDFWAHRALESKALLHVLEVLHLLQALFGGLLRGEGSHVFVMRLRLHFVSGLGFANHPAGNVDEFRIQESCLFQTAFFSGPNDQAPT